MNDTLPYKVRVLCTWVSKSDLSSYGYGCRIRRSLWSSRSTCLSSFHRVLVTCMNSWYYNSKYFEPYANTTWTVFLFFSEWYHFKSARYMRTFWAVYITWFCAEFLSSYRLSLIVNKYTVCPISFIRLMKCRAMKCHGTKNSMVNITLLATLALTRLIVVLVIIIIIIIPWTMFMVPSLWKSHLMSSAGSREQWRI